MSGFLHAIPDGTRVMVDVNVLVYVFSPQSSMHQSCSNFLERGVRGNLELLTTVAVAADVLHRMMVSEVLAQGLVQRSADAVPLLKKHPKIVTRLRRYQTVLHDLLQAQVDILPLTYRDLHSSRRFREQHGLLVNDSIIIAVMQRERIQYLATNDSDFERVPGIAVRMPTT